MHLFLTYYGSYYDETEKLCKECNEKYLLNVLTEYSISDKIVICNVKYAQICDS